jgi:ABC-type phosphate transport system ATPase subunit
LLGISVSWETSHNMQQAARICDHAALQLSEIGEFDRTRVLITRLHNTHNTHTGSLSGRADRVMAISRQ